MVMNNGSIKSWDRADAALEYASEYCILSDDKNKDDQIILECLHNRRHGHLDHKNIETFYISYPVMSWVIAYMHKNTLLAEQIIKNADEIEIIKDLSFVPHKTLHLSKNINIAQCIFNRVHGLKEELFDIALPLVKDKWLLEFCFRNGAVLTEHRMALAAYNYPNAICDYSVDCQKRLLIYAARDNNIALTVFLIAKLVPIWNYEKEYDDAIYKAMTYNNWSILKILINNDMITDRKLDSLKSEIKLRGYTEMMGW